MNEFANGFLDILEKNKAKLEILTKIKFGLLLLQVMSKFQIIST
jgi:hypothetical protein